MKKYSDDKYGRAKKQVDKLKGFYVHFTIYTIINAFILGNIYLQTADSNGGFWRWEHFSTLFFWGIGVFFHAMNTFGNPLFNKNWEKRQIEKYMNKDKEEVDKFKK